jgi:hypothetical protein
MAPGFEPNKIAGEASRDTNNQDEKHVQPASSHKSSRSQ